MRIESSDYLYRIYITVWRKLGATEEEARIFTDCLIKADLTGKDNQGIAGFTIVYPLVKRDALKFGVSIKILDEGPSYAVIDGGHGTGQVVTTKAMEVAIEKAQESVLGSVWLRNANDFTMAGNYSMQD